jgi:protease II
MPVAEAPIQTTVESTQGSGDAGSGFFVGTEPAQPRRQVDWDGANSPTAKQQVQLVEQHQPQAGVTYYTEEDLNKARQEEKNKLYARVNDMDVELKLVRKEREEREAAEKAAVEAAAAEARKQEEEALSAKQLVEKVREETAAQIAQLQAERNTERAVFDKEREFVRISEYQRSRLNEESNNIMPQLLDFVSGSTEAEIEASIERAKAKTAEIVGQVQQVAVQSRQEQIGVSPTAAPPVGPMENQLNTQSLTSADIAGMDMETYKQHRAALLPATRNAYQGRF